MAGTESGLEVMLSDIELQTGDHRVRGRFGHPQVADLGNDFAEIDRRNLGVRQMQFHSVRTRLIQNDREHRVGHHSFRAAARRSAINSSEASRSLGLYGRANSRTRSISCRMVDSRTAPFSSVKTT